MAPTYTLWRSELKAATPEDRRADRPTDPQQLSGFWRIHSARTKPDWPVAIWTDAGKDATVFQIGRKVMRTDTHAKEWQDFVDGGWLKCTAIEQADWSAALDAAKWADGKPSREPTAEERADIIPTTPAEQGGNAPVDESGEPIDQDWLQIKDNLARDTKALSELGAITTLEIANQAAEIIERMRANGTEGEKRRKAEKKPHDDAAAKVQAKWTPILNPASAMILSAVEAITKFKRAEEARLRREKEEADRIERERLAAIEAARIASAEEERRKQSEQMGMEHQPMSEDEIAVEAAAIAAEQVAATPQAETTVRVGTAHGRAVNKATVWGGKITDVDKFFQSIKDHVDTKEFLQKKADALGRAKAELPGFERVEK